MFVKKKLLTRIFVVFRFNKFENVSFGRMFIFKNDKLSVYYFEISKWGIYYRI